MSVSVSVSVPASESGCGGLNVRTIRKKLDLYLVLCREEGSEKRFPNLAGFARYLGVSLEEMAAFGEQEPVMYGRICTALEDEALNSGMQAAILTAYMKRRLGYAEEKEKEREKERDRGEGGRVMNVIFEHDMEEDGK